MKFIPVVFIPSALTLDLPATNFSGIGNFSDPEPRALTLDIPATNLSDPVPAQTLRAVAVVRDFYDPSPGFERDLSPAIQRTKEYLARTVAKYPAEKAEQRREYLALQTKKEEQRREYLALRRVTCGEYDGDAWCECVYGAGWRCRLE